jgi:hypothetical protein
MKLVKLAKKEEIDYQVRNLKQGEKEGLRL